MRLVVRPAAKEELLEAQDWYDAKVPNLGWGLVRCVDDCFQRIRRNPESYPVVHRDTRMAIVRRFPYLVFYRISGETISVISVFHAKRDPKIWKKR